MRPLSEWTQNLVVLYILVLWLTPADARKQAPVALEAGFKKRITVKLQDALTNSTAFLARALGVDEGQVFGSDIFVPGYEFDAAKKRKKRAGRWFQKCEEDVNETYDSVSNCCIHKLQALSAFCRIPEAAQAHRSGIRRLLKKLTADRGESIVGLASKNSAAGRGMSVWSTLTSVGSTNYEMSVSTQAAATLVVAECGNALGDKSYMDTAHSWFQSISKAWPMEAMMDSSHHLNCIIWEASSGVAAVVDPGTSFKEDLDKFNSRLGKHLQNQFEEDVESWSFSCANAAAMTWAGSKKSKVRKEMARHMDMYKERWGVLEKMSQMSSFGSTTYACGPIQGLAPLMLKRSGRKAPQLVGSILRYIETTIDLYLIAFDEGVDRYKSNGATILGEQILNFSGSVLHGAVMRDPDQLKNEKRNSIRIDDTSQCVNAFFRTLHMLEGITGVEVSGSDDPLHVISDLSTSKVRTDNKENKGNEEL